MNRLETTHEFKKGAVAGLISAIIMFFFIETFSWLDLIKFGQSYLGGETIFTYKNEPIIKVISFFMSISIGMFWGVILAFIFSKVLTDEYLILKGMGFGFVIFVFHLGILDESFKYTREIHDETGSLVIFFLGYMIYGISTSIILRKLGIFNDAKMPKEHSLKSLRYTVVPKPSMKKHSQKMIKLVKPKKL